MEDLCFEGLYCPQFLKQTFQGLLELSRSGPLSQCQMLSVLIGCACAPGGTIYICQLSEILPLYH